MSTKRWTRATLVLIALAVAPRVTSAQSPPRKPPAPPPAKNATTTEPTNLRSHVGTDHATRLIRGSADERIRGIQRAAAIGTPEAVAVLVDSLERSDRSSPIRADTRALVVMARSLARFADQERARSALLAIVGTGNPRPQSTLRDPTDEPGDPIARMELAREIAAIALAKGGGERALDALYGVARGGGSGQTAALRALSIFPPKDPGFFGAKGASLPIPVIRLLGELGDLRALEVLHAAARSSDVGARCAALVAIANLGDERAIALARTAIAESDVRLRAASGEVFIILGAPEREKATSALISDEATTVIGLQMAERVFSPEITKLVAARAAEHPNREIRKAAIRALGRAPDPNAAKALVAPQILADSELTYLALSALARSPAPNVHDLIGGLMPTRLSTLAVRAYVVRALVRGDRLSSSDDAIKKMVKSSKPAERAIAIFARVALGHDDAETFLDDGEPRVRRAAIMGSMAERSLEIGVDHDVSESLRKRLAREAMTTARKEDTAEITRQLLGLGLLGGDKDGIVKTATLVDRAESSGGDAPLAAFTLAARANESMTSKVEQLLGSKDPVIRAHAAWGVAGSSLPDATGRLAEAYAFETSIEVRRAIINALAARAQDERAPIRRETLADASLLDPDGPVRQTARRALLGLPAAFQPPTVREVAWLRMTRDGGAPPGEPFAGSLVRSDGVAVPIVFDEEGYAVVPNLPPGEARVILAPRLPSDDGRDKRKAP